MGGGIGEGYRDLGAGVGEAGPGRASRRQEDLDGGGSPEASGVSIQCPFQSLFSVPMRSIGVYIAKSAPKQPHTSNMGGVSFAVPSSAFCSADELCK